MEEAKNNKENIELLKKINIPIEESLEKEELETISKQIKKWIKPKKGFICYFCTLEKHLIIIFKTLKLNSL